MGLRTCKWILWIAKQRTSSYDLVRCIKKEKLGLTSLKKKIWPERLTKGLFGTMRFWNLENTQKTPFSNRMLLPRASTFLCVSTWTRSTPKVGWWEHAPFHGLLSPPIWRPVTTIYGDLWDTLPAQILSTQIQSRILKSHRQLQVLTRIHWKKCAK